jgi:mannose/fructose/N-acetylgalactosamine-specific phosphotransferase system component IIB
LVDLFLAVGVYVLWVKLKQPPQDDPRLSRGLQLLQSKIAVLEDLSDRTEVQVGQLTALLEQKVRKVQAKIEESQKQIQMIDQSMQRSREVAEIFQDKIPHEEIIERQNTIKYIKAAQLAHEGKTVAEISQLVDLPIGEIEFIAKVNRDQLQFDIQSLPDWALDNSLTDLQDQVLQKQKQSIEMTQPILQTPTATTAPVSLSKLGDQFRQAHQQMETSSVGLNTNPSTPAAIAKATPTAITGTTTMSSSTVKVLDMDKNSVRPFEFPRISTNKG